MEVGETNNRAALKAVMICAQEYALWNMRYFAKYPNLGYDVKDTPSDQKFVYGTYNSNEKVYRDKVDEVYEAVKDVHIHTGSNSSLFETGYVDTKSTDKDSYGTLYQDRALSLSKQGYTYKIILKDAYDNSSQMGIFSTMYDTENEAKNVEIVFALNEETNYYEATYQFTFDNGNIVQVNCYDGKVKVCE